MKFRDLTCPFCWEDRTELRWDIKGRPYFTCRACSARTFVPAPREAVRFIASTEPVLRAQREAVITDKAVATRVAEREAACAAALSATLRAADDETSAENVDDASATKRMQR